MSAAELLQIISLLFGLWLTYRGFRVTFSKEYYMRKIEGYKGANVDKEYDKLSKFHRQYVRYRWGLGGLGGGIVLLVYFVWVTFFS